MLASRKNDRGLDEVLCKACNTWQLLRLKQCGSCNAELTEMGMQIAKDKRTGNEANNLPMRYHIARA